MLLNNRLTEDTVRDLTLARAVPLLKLAGGIRPVSVVSTWRNLALTCLMRQHGQRLSRVCI
eukprot:5944369-Prorocentrum_lima.AAC.1